MKVGIIGAGTMGSGIAQVFAAEEGYQVVLCDISQELADKGIIRKRALYWKSRFVVLQVVIQAWRYTRAQQMPTC